MVGGQTQAELFEKMYRSTNTKQIVPHPIYVTSKETEASAKETLCFCKSIRPVLLLCRLVGFFPAVWIHENGKCVFQKSIPWLIYTFVVISCYFFQVFSSVDFLNLTQKKSLPILLNDITDAIYGVYIIILTIANIARYPKWVKTLNEIQSVLRDGIFCQSAMKVVVKIQYGFVAIIALIFTTQITILSFLHFSENYKSNFDYNIFVNKIMQNIPFIFYTLFCTMVSLFIGMLACFEKLTISCLKYVPVHPMKGIDETNNTRDFFGIVSYQICKGHHPFSAKFQKLVAPELVEYLRILHEDISLGIYKINSCMNPQFLFHTMVELTVLIIHWYAVIAYVAYDFKSPFARTIHVLNCLFVVLHTVGLFLFLKNAQQLKNMIQGLTNFLLEYSTRISSQEEHQQVRIFIEKLKQHRPFTASGVFTIDLSIAGPISANILTYVLVALQFEIPKE